MLKAYNIILMYIMRSFLIVEFISGNQPNATVNESIGGDNSVAQLPSSHQFNLRPVDLAKLLVIRTEKIKKKKISSLSANGSA